LLVFTCHVNGSAELGGKDDECYGTSSRNVRRREMLRETLAGASTMIFKCLLEWLAPTGRPQKEQEQYASRNVLVTLEWL